MKIRYLGTAAAEGTPSIFCDCERCRHALAVGGKEIRTRSQAIVNNDLLIDMPCDTYSHFIENKIDSRKIENILITHIHADHLYPEEIHMLRPGHSKPEKGFHIDVWGSEDVKKMLSEFEKECNGVFSVNILEPFKTVKIGNYDVTPLKAYHGTPNPYIYIVSDGMKTLLYAHDTDFFLPETQEYLLKAKPHFDLISLDCTMGNMEHSSWRGHMYFSQNVECVEYLLNNGLITPDTKVVINHFSHNAPESSYADMTRIAKPHGFIISFDGMEIEI